jgi:hypothetical protein
MRREYFNLAIDKYKDPWFIAKDLCDVLDVKNTSDALSRLDDDEKDDIILNDTVGKRQGYSVVNESGMYSLVMTSRKPEAKAFKKLMCNNSHLSKNLNIKPKSIRIVRSHITLAVTANNDQQS